MSRSQHGIHHWGVLVAAICLLVGTACTDGGAPPPSTPGISSSPLVPQWVPSKPLPRATMSESERDTLNRKRLARLAELRGIANPPQVDPVRWIYPEEVGTVVVECLRDAGFGATSSADGRGFTVDAGSQSQMASLNLAWYRCSAMYPTDPRASMDVWNEAQRRAAYEYLTTSLIPCLKHIGAEPAQAPSIAVYLSDPGRWEYPDPGNQARMELWTRDCPPNPPTRAILGEG